MPEKRIGYRYTIYKTRSLSGLDFQNGYHLILGIFMEAKMTYKKCLCSECVHVLAKESE